MFDANIMIMMLMFSPASDTVQMLRFEVIQNLRYRLGFSDQRQRISRRCGIIKQVTAFEGQIIRIKAVSIRFGKSSVIFTVFSKIGNKKFTVMLFFQIRNIAPMIRCRIFIRLKQRNNQFVVFYFGYLFSDFCRLAHGCIQIRPRRCVNHVFGLIFVIDQPDFFFNNCVGNLNVSPRHIYANAGVLLLDCEKWRKDNICQKLLQLADQYKQHIHIICEDILSIYFSENEYRLLPARYNLTDRDNLIQKTVAPAIDDNYLQEEWKHIILQHLSPGKAWKKAYNSETFRELKHFDSFWFFAEMTPFYAGLQKKFEYYNSLEATDRELSKRENQERKDISRILGVPVIALYKLGNKKRYKLFNLLTIMTVKGK